MTEDQTLSYLKQRNDFYRSKGAELLGAIVRLNVSVSSPLTLGDIRDVYLNNPDIPDDWAPTAESDVKLWLRTMVEAGRTKRVDKLVPNSAGEFEFDVSTHNGHYVNRVSLQSAEELVCAHSIIKMDMIMEPVFDANGQVVLDRKGNPVVKPQAVEADEGIKITLHRETGEPAFDCLGTNTWRPVVAKANGDEYASKFDVPRIYWPFIRTVWTRWEEKRDRKYLTPEVRDIINYTIKNHLKLDSIETATYFANPAKLDRLRSFADDLRDLHPGIRLSMWELPKWDDQSSDMVESVSVGLTDSVIAELKVLLDDMRNREDDDSTRQSTWLKRREDLLEIRNKVRDYSRLKLIQEDTLKQMFDEAKNLIIENMEAA